MQRKKKMTGLLLLAALILTPSLSGCGGKSAGASAEAAPGSSAAAKELDVIRLPTVTSFVGVSPYLVAQELGFDKEANLRFEFVGAVDAGQLVASVVAGKIDVGGGHVNRTIAGIHAGAKIRAVAANTETTEKAPHMTYVTLQNSPITTAQDIVGKKVGIPAFGGCNEYMPYAFLESKGIQNPKGKFEIVTAPEAKLEQALKQGEVDIIGLHENPDTIVKRGNLKILFTDFNIWGGDGGATPYYFSEKFIKEKPDVVRRFVGVIGKTNDYINANPEKAREITAKKGNVDPSIVRATTLASHALIKEETVQIWIDLLERFKEIKPGLKPSNIYTNEFNPAA